MTCEKKINSDELKSLQLEIAKNIKNVCEENNIEYFMVGGTLLGAVRHKGFIPWDDDIDLGMTTENFEKFLEVAPKCLDNRFFLQTSATDSFYFNSFAKVRLNNTHMQEKVTRETKMHDGIFVDIFSYDVADEKKANSKKIFNRTKID